MRRLNIFTSWYNRYLGYINRSKDSWNCVSATKLAVLLKSELNGGGVFIVPSLTVIEFNGLNHKWHAYERCRLCHVPNARKFSVDWKKLAFSRSAIFQLSAFRSLVIKNVQFSVVERKQTRCCSESWKMTLDSWQLKKLSTLQYL